MATLVASIAVEWGIREATDEIFDDVLALIADPVGLYESHARWPSLLTATGLPVELSVKVDEHGSASIRFVADVADHRRRAVENWTRYVRASQFVAARAARPPEELWNMCRLGISGAPAPFPARIMHGLGYGAAGASRGSLYLRTGWLPPDALAARFPDEMGALAATERDHGCVFDRRLEVIGFDFVAGRNVREKLYLWPLVDRAATFPQIVGHHPALEPARELFEAGRDDIVGGLGANTLLLQLAVEDDGVVPRLFFPAGVWGFDDGRGRDRLLEHVGTRLGIPLACLTTMADAAVREGLALDTGMVALGADGDGVASATFYLWPRRLAAIGCDPGAGSRDRISTRPVGRPPGVDTAVRRAIGFLDSTRSPDGSWSRSDAAATASSTAIDDATVTALTALLLTIRPDERIDLDATMAWLASRQVPAAGWVSPAFGWTDLDLTAAACEALARSGRPVPEDVYETLLRCRLADGSFARFVDVPADDDGKPQRTGADEVTAAVLSTILVVRPTNVGTIVPAVVWLAAHQHEDGRWAGTWWDGDLLTTWRAVRALRAYCDGPIAREPLGQHTAAAASRAVERARRYLAGRALVPEPWDLALWLLATAEVGTDPPDVTDATAILVDRQRPDGRWLGAPCRRAAQASTGAVREFQPGPVEVDDRCILTTVIAATALRHAGTDLS